MMHGPWHMPEHPDESDSSAAEREAEQFDADALNEAHALPADGALPRHDEDEAANNGHSKPSSHQGQPMTEDPSCTDCDGTGVTHQTERRCACQPAMTEDIRRVPGSVADASAATPSVDGADIYKALPADRGPAPLTAREFFGEAFEDWAAAINAAHTFAQRSGCPLGYDVIRWLGEQAERLQAENRARYGAKATGAA
jgi:hypothetical protein